MTGSVKFMNFSVHCLLSNELLWTLPTVRWWTFEDYSLLLTWSPFFMDTAWGLTFMSSVKLMSFCGWQSSDKLIFFVVVADIACWLTSMDDSLVSNWIAFVNDCPASNLWLCGWLPDVDWINFQAWMLTVKMMNLYGWMPAIKLMNIIIWKAAYHEADDLLWMIVSCNTDEVLCMTNSCQVDEH